MGKGLWQENDYGGKMILAGKNSPETNFGGKKINQKIILAGKN